MRNNLATLYTPLSTAPVVPQTLIKGIQRLEPRTSALFMKKWCPGADLNHRHADFQSAALPTELPGHLCGRELGRFDNRAQTKQIAAASHA